MMVFQLRCVLSGRNGSTQSGGGRLYTISKAVQTFPKAPVRHYMLLNEEWKTRSGTIHQSTQHMFMNSKIQYITRIISPKHTLC